MTLLLLLSLALLACGRLPDSVPDPVPGLQPPQAPRGLVARHEGTRIVLSWQAGEELEEELYRLYRGLSRHFEAGPATLLASTTEPYYEDPYYLDGQVSATTYYYRVSAVSERGLESAPSEAVAAPPPDGGEDGGDDGGDDGDGDPDGPEHGADLVWSQAKPAPYGFAEGQGAVLGGELYVFGGYTSWNPFRTSQLAYAYDPRSDSWRRLKDMPVAWSHAVAATDGATIYWAGGYLNPNDDSLKRHEIPDGSKEIYAYDTEKDTWLAELLPPLPEARGAGGFVRLGRYLHFFGGHDEARNDKADHWVLSLDDPHSWQTRAPLPVPLNHLGSVVLDGSIYAIGGQTGHTHTAQHQASLYRYDAQQDAWTRLSDLLTPLSHHAASSFVMEGRILTVGGEQAHEDHLAAVYAYDPGRDVWSALTALPEARGAGVAAAVQGVVVFTGGGAFKRDTFVGVPKR